MQLQEPLDINVEKFVEDIFINNLKETLEQTKNCSCRNSHAIMNLVIESIDGVGIDAVFKVHKKNDTDLIIIFNIDFSSDYLIENGDEITLYSEDYPCKIDNIEDIILKTGKIIQKIPLLKYSKQLGIFTSVLDDDTGMKEERKLVFLGLKNYLTNKNQNLVMRKTGMLDECSVCKELTSTHTRCKHHLCFECWTAIGKKAHADHDGDDDNEPVNICCPICRQDIRFN